MNSQISHLLQQKMREELEALKKKLEHENGKTVLEHAYEFVVKSEFLSILPNANISDKLYLEMLKQQTPLANLYQHFLHCSEYAGLDGIPDVLTDYLTCLEKYPTPKRYRDSQGHLTKTIEEIKQLTAQEAGEYFQNGKRYMIPSEGLDKVFIFHQDSISTYFVCAESQDKIFCPLESLGTYLPSVSSEGMEIICLNAPDNGALKNKPRQKAAPFTK